MLQRALFVFSIAAASGFHNERKNTNNGAVRKSDCIIEILLEFQDFFLFSCENG